MKSRINGKLWLCIFLLLPVFIFAGCENGTTPVTGDSEMAEVLISNGYYALEAQDIDEAIDAFQAAYVANKTNETRMYAALAKLAAISIDQNIVDLMRNRLGFIKYPEKINALINQNEWWEYTGDEFYQTYFPVLADAPEWLGTTSLPLWERLEWLLADAPEWLLGTTRILSPYALWFALILDNNTMGFNSLVDEALNSAFGQNYTDAVALIDEMDNTPVTLDSRLIELLELTETLGKDTVKITKAELKIFTSAFDILKGTLEFLQAYNLDTPLNFLKFDWNDEYTFNLGAYDESIDPCRNGFLKQRDGYTTKTAINTYIKALGNLTSAYDSLIEDNNHYPTAAKDFLKKYKCYRTLATNIKTALENIGSVNGDTEVGFPSADEYGVLDFDKNYFSFNFKALEDGYLKIENLILLNKEGKPVFKTWTDVVVNNENIKDYSDGQMDFGPVFTPGKFFDNIIKIDGKDPADSWGEAILSVCSDRISPKTYELYEFYYGKISNN